MAHYRIEKVGRRHANVFDAAGEYVCQLRNHEVADWLRRAEKAIEDAAWFAARAREQRKAGQAERVQAYLARRAARAVQLPLI